MIYVKANLTLKVPDLPERCFGLRPDPFNLANKSSSSPPHPQYLKTCILNTSISLLRSIKIFNNTGNKGNKLITKYYLLDNPFIDKKCSSRKETTPPK